MEFKTSNVGGLETACLDRKELVNLMVELSEVFDREKSKSFVISSTNGHSVSLYNSDKRTREIIDDVDLLHADGQSIVTMSRWFCKHPIPERSATTDMFTDVPEYSDKVLNHYLLGGKKDTVRQCAETMEQRYNNFKVAGWHDGYFSESETQSLIDEINSKDIDVLWVGLGKPKEQEFVFKYRHELKVPVIITCGGCFNYVTGEYSRAPELMQKFGLEWLHRALSEPKKLLWRYITTNPHALFCGFKHYLKK